GTGRGWIITLCRRRAIDRVRAVQAQRDRDWAQGVGQLGAVGEPAEDTAVAQDEALRTVTALRDLGEPHASTIALAYFRDMSHAQISQELDVPLGTVKSRIRDGMTRLRTMLEGGRGAWTATTATTWPQAMRWAGCPTTTAPSPPGSSRPIRPSAARSLRTRTRSPAWRR